MPRERPRCGWRPIVRLIKCASNIAVSTAARFIADGEYTKAFASVTQPAAQQGRLFILPRTIPALAQLRLDKDADALRVFNAIAAQKPVGYLAEASLPGQVKR